MPNTTNNQTNNVFVDDAAIYGQQTKAVPTPPPQVGVDTRGTFYNNIIDSGVNHTVDVSIFESFFQSARSRDEIYALIDVMGEDATVAAILETYAEDATEYNENGHIVWAESSDPDVSKYVNFLLKSINVDKNIYKWVHSLAKYGDVYLRLYRESDYNEDAELFADENQGKQKLNEAVKIHAYSKNDHYAHYIGMIPNPAEMFELTKFDKSYAYIKADIGSLNASRPNGSTGTNNLNTMFKYRFKQKDINIFRPTDFVHACLEDDNSRTPEEIVIFKDDKSFQSDSDGISYTVHKGQSLLYPTFKIWRELALLENVILLNRVTKSSIVRVINVEVGDMAKESVIPHMENIKRLFEQKASLDTGKFYSEYTNPGPVENNVYVPTRNGIGGLSTQQVGGDVDVGKLSDVDHFQDKFFGAMRVPKQYFGITDDNAGFSGGQSLALISSRYAKMVKRLQNTMIQALVDAINLMLLDRNLSGYIGKFTLKMTPPVTQEDLERREANTNKVRLVSDVMDLLNALPNDVTKLKALKELLAEPTSGTNITNLIQEEIDKLENQDDTQTDADSTTASKVNEEGDINIDIDNEQPRSDLDSLIGLKSSETAQNSEDSDVELPSPESLQQGLDFTNNTNPEFAQ